MEDYNKLLNIATDVGYLLLKNGAEIYRVEESMLRIVNAYGVEGDIYAINNCIIATVNTKDGQVITKTKRLYDRGTDFDKVIKLNDLCRRICATTPELESIQEELKQICERPVYSKPIQILATIIVSAFFTLFFKGNLADALCGAIAGAVMKLIMLQMEKFQTNKFFTLIVSSAAVAATTLLTVHFHLGTNVDIIIIGTLMNLVPGVALTNAMRDFITGDLVSGITKLIEALFIATSIALGAGIAIYGTRIILGM